MNAAYELALVANKDLNESEITLLCDLVQEVVKAHEGEVLLQDDWGTLNFPQQTNKHGSKGHYLYFVYHANNLNNVELARRFKINEGVVKHMVVRVGEESDLEEFVKNVKTPFSKKYSGSVSDDQESENIEKDRKRFIRKKTCWFSAKQIKADWKDPKTYQWLLNEFGKISPARMTSVSRKHQRFSNNAIKRARNIGLISHISQRIAE